MPKGQTLTERFNNRYQIDNKTGCWEWTGSKDVDGYGVIYPQEPTLKINSKQRNVKETPTYHQIDLIIIKKYV